MSNYLSVLSLIVAVVAAATAGPECDTTGPSIPTYYSYGGYPRIQTNISWGTPPQTPVPAIFDTGSIAFWTYKSKAIINDGSQYLGVVGPCNKTVKNAYNPSKSSSASKINHLQNPDVYSYGGNGKLITAYELVNDTMSFPGENTAAIKNTQVALSNFTVVRQLDQNCAISVDTFDQSILGLGPYGVGGSSVDTVGPSFRTNLKTRGTIKKNIMSLWMNKAPSNIKGTFHGTALFGQTLPKSAYKGDLLAIKQSPPDESYVGYYSALPKLSINKHSISSVDTSVKNCLIDSGTGLLTLPYNSSVTAQYSKLIEYSPDGSITYAWNASCNSVPADATLDFAFPGVEKGKSVTVKLLVRNLVRGLYAGTYKDPICPLSIELDTFGSCVLGAPFFTASAWTFDDEQRKIYLAQGGVA